MTHRHDRAKEFIIAFISEEVLREKSENTIFRSNSVTSKMFKFYAKLIGTRFLWSKTARIIVELNTIAAQKMKDIDTAKKRGTSGGGSSLFTMEMEYEPSLAFPLLYSRPALESTQPKSPMTQHRKTLILTKTPTYCNCC